MSTNGKGSKRRPQQVTQKTFETNWDRAFGKPKAPKKKSKDSNKLSTSQQDA